MDVNNKEYEPVIEAKHISKTFRLYKRKRDVVKQVLKGNKKRFYSEYCALDNFNLVLNKGDSVGIIGKNGRRVPLTNYMQYIETHIRFFESKRKNSSFAGTWEWIQSRVYRNREYILKFSIAWLVKK